MKEFNLVILLLLLMISCQSPQKKALVFGSVTGEVPETIKYTIPINGICNWSFAGEVKPDSIGRFSLELDINEVTFIKFNYAKRKYGTLIAEPGKTYNVFLDMQMDKEHFTVSGNSKDLHSIYNQLPNPIHIQFASRKYMRDTVANSIDSAIEEERKNEIAEFESLYNANKIPKDIFELLLIDRNCYYDATLSTIMWIKYLNAERGSGHAFTEEFDSLWRQVHEPGLINKPALHKSYWFNSYAECFIFYQQYLEGRFGVNTSRENPFTYHVANAKKYLPSGIVEHYFAHYLNQKASQKKYEKELVPLFQEFESDYPKSDYITYISPLIEEVSRFAKLAESEFKDDVKFLEGYQEISSLSEAAGKLGDGIIYIDVWATWCGPCKAEFEHNSVLRKVLKENNVQLLYISLDKEEYSEKWKNMIKFYELDGYHIRANEELFDDLSRLFDMDGAVSIPWYILINNEGTILKKHASKPSHPKELEKELEEL
jgi:thiol-disulfide isomerase/thioredoxin